jgi:hypothetical protein
MMLVADQGFGDVIQFSRYIPWVAERCPNLILACAKELQSQVRQVMPGLKVFDRWDERPDFVSFCPLSGLPRLHGTRIETIPNHMLPYLRADPARVARWRTRIDRLAPTRYQRIGITWAGRPTHNNDVNRSATLNTFATIADLPNTALVSLQKGPAQAQCGNYYGRAPLINLSAEIEDFDDTAAIIETLDLLVTVDTSVAHLAAAMGKPVWIMLPYAPDWRWLLDRDDTPWYPSVRLFRQTEPRRWDDVMARIADGVATRPVTVRQAA